MIEAGQLVAPPMMPDQSGAFRVINLGNLYVESLIPESFIGKIRRGSSVNVNIPVNQSSFESTVKHSGSSIDPKSRTFRMKRIFHKQFNNAKYECRGKYFNYTNKAILIPESIVSEDSENKFVFVVKNNTAVKVVIQTGYTQNGFI